MTEHQPLPVAGYTSQSDEKVALVNEGKILEERALRYIEKVQHAIDGTIPPRLGDGDPRFLAIGRTDIQKGFMMVYRSVFNPGRARLPEDGESK